MTAPSGGAAHGTDVQRWRALADSLEEVTANLHHDESPCTDVCNVAADTRDALAAAAGEVERLRAENKKARDEGWDAGATAEANEWRAERDRAVRDALDEAIRQIRHMRDGRSGPAIQAWDKAAERAEQIVADLRDAKDGA